MSSERICIITTNKKGFSETFIRNHIQYLPFHQKVLYEGMSPVLYNWETEEPLYNPYLYKIKKHLFSKLGTFSEERFTSTYLSIFLKKHKIQVVLAEFGPVGENVVEACRIAKIPLVVHFHGDDAHKKEYINRYNGYQKLVKYAKEIVCVSNTMKEQLTRLGFSDQQLHLIPCGIDVSFFSGGNSATSAPVFLAVGRFVDKKAPHLSILAFEKVLKKVPNAQLIMIGAGPLLSACKALVRSLGITGQVDFKGICTPDEVQQCMKNARAFLMHSVTPETGEKEGTPVSILEASASGLPVISTFHAGISEAVLHEKTGFLVNEYDVEKMSAYMMKLAENPSLAQQMGEAGTKHIKVSYSLQQQTDKLANVIRSCVA